MKRARRFGTFANQRGFSLIEVMIGVTIMTAAVLGLAATTTLGLKHTSRSREDTQFWGDAQQVMDSLVGRGFGQVVSGQTTIRGRSVRWEVGSSASAPQLIRLIATRNGYQNRFRSVSDTIIVYLSKTVPGA
jgi:prepilin-type N-terminal cleavage/methylation domain-containing protein